MVNKTVLYDQHIILNAKIVDFAGWMMPLHYGSQLEEHQAVRHHAGVFDVSHMNIVDIKGKSAKDFLRYIMSNDIAKLAEPGRAIYTCMLNTQGGIIDDLIIYYLSPGHYRLVLNAGTREKDNAWLKQQAENFEVKILPQKKLAIIALQGPHALIIAESVFGGAFATRLALLKPFQFAISEEMMVARTGYTGEDGFEIILPNSDAVGLWQKLIGAGAHPIGLGARDSLRLEAGFNLYGSDMDESTTPLESNLAWTVAWEPNDRDFIGRKALEAQQEKGFLRALVGFILEKGGILRHDQEILVDGKPVGIITSGGFSPTLNCSIAMARITQSENTEYQVNLRGKLLPLQKVKPTFVKKGKRLV